MHGLVGTSLHVTDCASEHTKGAQTPALPVELVDIIVDYAIQGMRETKEGAAVAKLMHVSSLIRHRVMREFRQLRLHEDVSRQSALPSSCDSVVLVPLLVVWAVWKAAEEYLLDCSTRRHGKLRPHMPNDWETITTKRNEVFNGIACEIIVSTGDGSTSQPEVKQNSYDKSYAEEGGDLVPQDVFDAIDAVLQDEGMRTTPRLASAYHRAVHCGTFEKPDAQVIFTVKLTFSNDGSDGGPPDENEVSWTFCSVDV